MNNLTVKEEKLVAKIQKEIHYCYNCQAYEGGEMIWVQGVQCNLDSLLDDYKVPEKSRDNIVNQLSCLYCGTELERYDEIGLQEHYDREVEEHLIEAKKKYGERINQLSQGLVKYPTLALKFPLAKSILAELKTRKLPECTIEGAYFRARRVSDAKILTSDDLLAPPVGKPEEGRFNHSGQSHFYIAEQKETAIRECLTDDNPALLWVQKFTIAKIDKILDLSTDWDKLGYSTSTLLVALHNAAVLRQSSNNKEKWKPDYNITRFIMDCAKMTGYHGIKYNSVKDITGINIVLFECSKALILSSGKPEVVTYTPVKVDLYADDLFGDAWQPF